MNHRLSFTTHTRRLRSTMRRFSVATAAGATFMLLMALATATAHAQSFLFEDVASSTYAGSLAVTHGGQTLTVAPDGSPNGSVSVILRDAPLLQGVIANQGSTPMFGFFAPLRFTFSKPVTSITFGFDDSVAGNGGDVDGSVTIKAYDSASNLLGTMFYNNPSYDGGTYQTLSGTFGGASYFIASSPDLPSNMNSLAYEVVDSAAVPEPAFYQLGALLALGGLGVLRSRRRT